MVTKDRVNKRRVAKGKPGHKKSIRANEPIVNRSKGAGSGLNRVSGHIPATADRPIRQSSLVKKMASWILVFALLGLLVLYVFDKINSKQIHTINLFGDYERIDLAQVQSILKQQLNKDWKAFDFEAVQAQLLLLDWVDKVKLQKKWPNTLKVTLLERQAFALWQNEAIFDTRGELFRIKNMQSIPEKLPKLSLVVSPLEAIDIENINKNKSDLFKQSLIQQKRDEIFVNFVNFKRMTTHLPFEVTEFIQSSQGVVTIVFDMGTVAEGLTQMKVHSLSDQLLDAWPRFMYFYQGLSDEQKTQLEMVDLRYKQGLSIKWKEADGSTNN